MSERRGWRDHPLVQLTLVRYREFFREPEAVFWVFIFPVLLTAGLGIAFRNQAPERMPVAVVEGEGARGWRRRWPTAPRPGECWPTPRRSRRSGPARSRSW